MHHPEDSPFHHLSLSINGDIVLYSRSDLSIHVFSVNGVHIASLMINEVINCFVISPDMTSVITGGELGILRIYYLHNLSHRGDIQINNSHDLNSICSLSFSENGQYLFVGLHNGQCLCVSDFASRNDTRTNKIDYNLKFLGDFT